MNLNEKRKRLTELEGIVLGLNHGGSDRMTARHHWPEIKKLREELGVNNPRCVWLGQCMEMVSKLHFEMFCMKNPDGCGVFEMYEEGQTPQEWLEQLLKVKT